MKRLAALVLVFVLTMSAMPALAMLVPAERLDDPALEARARSLSSELRCLVCQNQSIDDSDAELARDLRILVRERVAAGDSDGEVIDYVVSRYGEFVLLRPPFNARNLVLWGAPAALILAGVTFMFVAARRRRGTAAAPLSADEQRRLDDLLKRDPAD